MVFPTVATQKVTFTVSHFTGYAAGDTSNLVIYDSNDTGKIINAFENATFYANYTNATSGNSVNGSNVSCQISFKILANWTQPANMTYNPTSLLYEYIKAFANYGTYTWNVSCSHINGNFSELEATDTIVINGTASQIPSGAGTGNTGGGAGGGDQLLG